MLGASLCGWTAKGACTAGPRIKSPSGICICCTNQRNPQGMNSPSGTRCALSYWYRRRECGVRPNTLLVNPAAPSAARVSVRYIVHPNRQRRFGRDDKIGGARRDEFYILRERGMDARPFKFQALL